MKKLIFIFMLGAFLATGCKNSSGSETDTTTEPASAEQTEIMQLDSVTNELEQEKQNIEEKKQELEEVLDDLPE